MKKEGVQTRKRKPRSGEVKRRHGSLLTNSNNNRHVQNMENGVEYILSSNREDGSHSGIDSTSDMANLLSQQSYEENCQQLLQPQQQIHMQQQQQMMLVQESQVNSNGKKSHFVIRFLGFKKYL